MRQRPRKNCNWCKKEFYQKANTAGIFCSALCQTNHLQQFNITIECANCGKELNRTPSEASKSKSGNHFCSCSCAATYNNTHKTHGTRKSKLEVWLGEKLPTLFPELEFHFNKKDAINSELDIYIPSLKLAFELNGIFHYEPIYGENKLKQIQSNDSNKFLQCQNEGISLCIIDTSSYAFNEKTCKKYLDIITSIIQDKTECG